MLYDGHAYCFPKAGSNTGFDDPAVYWRHLQLFMASARQQPSWRKSDRVPADASGLLADPSRPWDLNAVKEAGFRVGDFGLVEWTVNNSSSRPCPPGSSISPSHPKTWWPRWTTRASIGH